MHRVRAVHDVIKHTVDVSAGLSTSELTSSEPEKFLTLEDHKRVQDKLRDLLTSVCDYCHERLAALVSTQSDKQTIISSQIVELSVIVEGFTELCEKVCGSRSPALKAAFKIQAGNYVNKFHNERKNNLLSLLDTERWNIAEVPPKFQVFVDRLASGSVVKSMPSSPVENGTMSNLFEKPANGLKIGSQEYVTVGTVLMLIKLVSEYCVCACDLPLLAPTIGKHLANLLRTFNSRSYKLILCADALKTAGLNTITTMNIALMSRALQLVLWLIPHIRAHFSSLCSDPLVSLDEVERDVGYHIRELETKVLSIMNCVLSDQINVWDAKPPVPSQAFRNISKRLTKLHETVRTILPEEQVRNFKWRCIVLSESNFLKDPFIKTNKGDFNFFKNRLYFHYFSSYVKSEKCF